MEFEKIRETWIPMDDPLLRLEKWECPDCDCVEDSPSEDAYYVVTDANGTELMNTTDWSMVLSYLRAILGDDVVPDDFTENPESYEAAADI